jgi:hypothetical protein
VWRNGRIGFEGTLVRCGVLECEHLAFYVSHPLGGEGSKVAEFGWVKIY